MKKKNNTKQSSVHTETKNEAADKARQFSKNQKTKLAVHNKDGQIFDPTATETIQIHQMIINKRKNQLSKKLKDLIIQKELR